MYKLKIVCDLILKAFKSLVKRFGRKLVLISAAIMLGLYNAIYEEDKMIDLNKAKTERTEDKKKGKK